MNGSSCPNTTHLGVIGEATQNGSFHAARCASTAPHLSQDHLVGLLLLGWAVVFHFIFPEKSQFFVNLFHSQLYMYQSRGCWEVEGEGYRMSD